MGVDEPTAPGESAAGGELHDGAAARPAARAGLLAPDRLSRLGGRAVWCVAIGLVAGLGALVFQWLLQAAQALFLGYLGGYVPTETAGEPSPFGSWLSGLARQPVPWVLVLLPGLGGLLSGLVVQRFAPEAAGHGTDAAILSFHQRGGRVRAVVPFVKMIASALTLGTGGSGGREGPIAQIGSGFGSQLASRLGLPDSERRLFMLAGVGAGVAAIFRAPLAGALFAAEVLYQSEELEHEALLPTTIASVTAYSVFASVHGFSPIFRTPSLSFGHPRELLGYALLGLVCAAGGWLYVRAFYGTHAIFARLAWPNWLKPAVGGLLTGLVGLALPAALATSYGVLQEALDGSLPARGALFFLALGLAKIAATSFSIGSGGSGGVFGPAMVIGGSLGYACGLVCEPLGLVGDARSMMLVGMAGFFGGAAHAPLSTIIMVSEMTGDYHLLVPSMLTVTISVVLLRGVRLYREQVRDRLASPAHRGESMLALLSQMPVESAMDQADESVRDDLPLSEAVRRLGPRAHTRYAVTNRDGAVVGVLDVRGVLSALLALDADKTTVADVMDTDFGTVGPHTNLREAVAQLEGDPHGLLVVVDAINGRLLGTLRRQDVLRAWATRS